MASSWGGHERDQWGAEYGEVDAYAGRSKSMVGAQRGGDLDDDIHAAQQSSEHQQHVYGL